MQFRVKATRNARKHNGLRGVFADEMLRCASGVHGTHASGRGDHRQTVELAAYNSQARLLRHMGTV